MERVNHFIWKIASISGHISGWLVSLMMILVAVEVFTRYFLHQPLMVADEFSAYMLVALSYLGMAYTWRQGGHVRISILISRLPARLSNWIRLISLSLIFIFMIEMVRVGYKMVAYARQIDLRSPTWLTIPLFWPQLTVFLGFVIFAVVLGVDLISAIGKMRAGKSLEEKIK